MRQAQLREKTLLISQLKNERWALEQQAPPLRLRLLRPPSVLRAPRRSRTTWASGARQASTLEHKAAEADALLTFYHTRIAELELSFGGLVLTPHPGLRMSAPTSRPHRHVLLAKISSGAPPGGAVALAA